MRDHGSEDTMRFTQVSRGKVQSTSRATAVAVTECKCPEGINLERQCIDVQYVADHMS